MCTKETSNIALFITPSTEFQSSRKYRKPSNTALSTTSSIWLLPMSSWQTAHASVTVRDLNNSVAGYELHDMSVVASLQPHAQHVATIYLVTCPQRT